MFDKLIMIFIGLIVLAIPVAIFYAAKDQERWENWCHSQGGHVKETNHTVTTYNYQKPGQPSYGTDTTYYCLSSDGRVLDVK